MTYRNKPDTPSPNDDLYVAWSIIANARDWLLDYDQAAAWRAAAERWRDERFHPSLEHPRFLVTDNQAVHEGKVYDLEVQAVSEAQSYHATYTLKSGVIPSGPVRYGRTVTARLRPVDEA